ncbi:MAG: GNAT family N-acetyltransferase [Bacteroidetes bacterium]|jgi:[ribosomal protein S5]-alanine N-acetyltransferase|nr:GNAT family N-acetyltransferase [Bacteroidota bacterium]
MSDYNYPEHLESARLTSRYLSVADIKGWTDFFRDKDAVELFPNFGNKSNEERAKQWIERQLIRYSEKRYGLQAILEKGSGNFLGMTGLLAQEVDGKQELEVGYHMFKKSWGQGFAPESAKMFIDFAFKNNLADSIVSIIDTRNVRSQRVALKNGLRREKHTRWMDLDVYIYRIKKNEWPVTA